MNNFLRLNLFLFSLTFIIFFGLDRVGLALAGVYLETDPYYYRNDNSALGKYNGPIQYLWPVTGNRYRLTGTSTSGSYLQANMNTYLSKTTQSGFNFLTIPNQPDGGSYGLEDANWKIGWCNGSYTYPNSTLSDTTIRTCYQGWIAFGYDGTAYLTPYASDGLNWNRFDAEEYSFALSASYNPNEPKYAKPKQHRTNFDSLGGFLSMTQTCTPKNVCSDASAWGNSIIAVSQRDSLCQYQLTQVCNGICIEGVCDPAAVPASNATPPPITPVTLPSALSSPVIVSTGGLQQCRPFNRRVTYGGLYEYYIDQPYFVDIQIPAGTQILFTLTSFDSPSANSSNQTGIYTDMPDFNPDDWAYQHPELWNSTTGVLSVPLAMSYSGGYYGSLIQGPWGFKNAAEASRIFHGIYTRGDSFVFQTQAYFGGQRNYYQGSANAPQVGYPAYFHYTLPTYEQCSPPDPVTPVVQRSTMTCGQTTNTISWNPATGADQYQIAVENIDHPGVVPYTGVGEILATTTATSYVYTVNYPMNGDQYRVKVYAHNSHGWNIASTTAQFVTAYSCHCNTAPAPTYPNTVYNGTSGLFYSSENAPCTSQTRSCLNSVLSGSSSYKYLTCSNTYSSCTGPDGSIVAAGASKTYYDRASSPTTCVGISRTCSATTGELSGDPSYIYGTCTYPHCTGPDGSIVAGGASKTYYLEPTDTVSCTGISRTCNGTTGVLSGNTSYVYGSCTVVAPHCTGPGNIWINNGESHMYAASTVGTPTCTYQNRTCTCVGNSCNLSGSYTATYCTPPGQSCTGPDGSTIVHADSKTYYSNTEEPCDGMTFTCDDSVLVDSIGDPVDTNTLSTYNHPSCPLLSPCDLPEGGTIEDGASKEYWFSPTDVCSNSETRVCDNGVLSGTYTSTSCSDNCTGPNGAVYTPGQGATFWSESSGTCTDSLYRTCTNGVMTCGVNNPCTYVNATCTPTSCYSASDGSVTANGSSKLFWRDSLPCAQSSRLCTNGVFGAPTDYNTTGTCSDTTTTGLIRKFTPNPTVVNPGGTTTFTITVADATNGVFIYGTGVDPANPLATGATALSALDASAITSWPYTLTWVTGPINSSTIFSLKVFGDSSGQTRTSNVIINPLSKEH